MKIVDRETFLKLPEGTVYSEFNPCVFGELCIKGESIGSEENGFGSWCYQPIADAVETNGPGDIGGQLFDLTEDSLANGTSMKMDFDCSQRDGFYDEDQLFAVWERQDVEALIARLQETLEPREERT